MGGATTRRPAAAPISAASVRDVDGYRGAVGGVDIAAIRAGQGSGPNRVMTVSHDDVTLTACDIGFPIRSHTTLGDDRLVISVMRTAPPGNRWCGIDLRPGLTLVHGPAAEHNATNREGLGFTFATTSAERLQERADQLGISIDLPGRGEVRELAPTTAAGEIRGAFAGVTTRGASRHVPITHLDGLVTAMAHNFAEADDARPRREARRLDSLRIVRIGRELALRLGRVPAIHELCQAAHVSERRLREAFTSVYDTPPSVYFRDMMLDEAHRRLLLGVDATASVSSVALDLGFDHLGRFAQRYRRVYGELPSETLRQRVPTFAP